MLSPESKIESVAVSAYKIPTDYPESDGTLAWDSTTIVVVEVRTGGVTGIGYTYSDIAAAKLIESKLAKIVSGQDTFATPACWKAMVGTVRNLGRPGLCAEAISAVDIALWDLKAKLLDLPLMKLLGPARSGIPVYGSGGFTSYPLNRLAAQLSKWAESGIRMVKMKIGREPQDDLSRVRHARNAIGPSVQLFVDANGAYGRKQALHMAEAFANLNVNWFEEPVSSDDLEGLRLLRDRAPAMMDITAGEYGFDDFYFRRMLEAGAVDVMQADASRCGGITGFMSVAALCQAFHIPLSAHTAPMLHLHPCCAALGLKHLEYFHDHVRIETMLFDGASTPKDGVLYPDDSRPGLGIEFRRADAEKYKA